MNDDRALEVEVLEQYKRVLSESLSSEPESGQISSKSQSGPGSNSTHSSLISQISQNRADPALYKRVPLGIDSKASHSLEERRLKLRAARWIGRTGADGSTSGARFADDASTSIIN